MEAEAESRPTSIWQRRLHSELMGNWKLVRLEIKVEIYQRAAWPIHISKLELRRLIKVGIR